jgi:hypothetical protein
MQNSGGRYGGRLVNHIVLLGDSIFDNASYVKSGPDVIRQLQGKLPDEWNATLCAVDGNRASDVRQQLARLPRDASHLIVSAGGNDALDNLNVLDEKAQSAAQVLNRLADVADGFRQQYREMLGRVRGTGLPTAVCTVYYPRFPDPVLQRLAVTALTTFNDVIVTEAFMAGVPLLDLRLICNEDADYANPIEPSVAGGEKITDAILLLIAECDFLRQRTEVFK